MDARTRLGANLVSESEAYGYTLSIWGAGALLVLAGNSRPLVVFFAVGSLATVAYNLLLLLEELLVQRVA